MLVAASIESRKAAFAASLALPDRSSKMPALSIESEPPFAKKTRVVQVVFAGQNDVEMDCNAGLRSCIEAVLDQFVKSDDV